MGQFFPLVLFYVRKSIHDDLQLMEELQGH